MPGAGCWVRVEAIEFAGGPVEWGRGGVNGRLSGRLRPSEKFTDLRLWRSA